MMRENVPEFMFATRKDFRMWLFDNAEKSDGVWLVFGKTKAVVTLSAQDALEEALCFGWIDGQMKSIDQTMYKKYFARRRLNSHWSEKNKHIVGLLRKQGIMTALGEKAVAAAMRNGKWDAPKDVKINDEHAQAFAQKLTGISPARENFENMPASVRLTYTKRYLSFKTEEARARDFEKIVDRLNKNLKPM